MFNLKVDMTITAAFRSFFYWCGFFLELVFVLISPVLENWLLGTIALEDEVISVRRKSDKIFGLLLTIIGELSIVVTCKVADVNGSNSRPVN